MKQYTVSVRVSHYREIEIEVPDDTTLQGTHHAASAAARIMFKEAESVLVIGWQEKKQEEEAAGKDGDQ